MKIRLFTIPNLVTLCNLLCGSMAALTALTGGDLSVAFWFILAAAVCDFLDGLTARLLNSYSGIGVELDSLADMVSFGFAPAAILYQLFSQAQSHWAWSEEALLWGGCSLFLLTAFSALRLAKFNVDEEQHSEFTGLPTPAAALFCTSLGWLVAEGRLVLSAEVICVVAWLLALLLISPIRMFSFKFSGFGWRGNGLRYLFALTAVALFAWLRVGAVPLIILLYVFVSTIRHCLCQKGCLKKK